MPLTCLRCRKVVGRLPVPSGGACPKCGGELAGEDGAWLEWSGAGGTGLMMLPKDRIIVGRRSESDLVIKDNQVSKVHASIHREGDSWYIRDWCSANGTRVNGQRVAEKKLEDGDRVSLGGTEICFHTRGVPSGSAGITIVPQSDLEETIQACLSCEPGEFKPEGEIQSEQELRSDYQRLRTAYLFQCYMGRERDERALMRNILKFTFEHLPADRGAILLRKEEGAPLAPAIAHHRNLPSGEGKAFVADGMVIPDSILRRTVEERSAILSGDAMVDKRFVGSESVLHQNVRSAMCVPLVGQNEVLGAIHLDTIQQTNAFSVKDLQLLSVLASQAASVIERSRLQKRLEKEAVTRERLSRFLAPQVLQEVVERGLDLDGEGRTGGVTVLFCDIRGFSGLAETMNPTQLVRVLNAFFERMVDVVFEHGGFLDKFIGDALMAVWGAPIQRSTDAVRAVSAGREMLRATELFNQSSSGQGWPELRVGVGANTGEAVIGTVGSSRRMEYTVMGDAVNVAARICDLAQGGQMLVSEKTLAEIPVGSGDQPRIRELPPAQIRGRKTPMRIYELLEA